MNKGSATVTVCVPHDTSRVVVFIDGCSVFVNDRDIYFVILQDSSSLPIFFYNVNRYATSNLNPESYCITTHYLFHHNYLVRNLRLPLHGKLERDEYSLRQTRVVASADRWGAMRFFNPHRQGIDIAAGALSVLDSSNVYTSHLKG